MLIDQMEEVSDVTVHIDPEDDEVASPSDQLPSRREILKLLNQQWHDLDLGPGIEQVMLHYLDGKIHVDVFLKMEGLDTGTMTGLSARIRASAQRVEDIGDVTVNFRA